MANHADPKVQQPTTVLALLLAANLLNYIDRQVLYAVFPLIKIDFHLSDTALGLLGSAFMLCYMLAAPLFGWLGDHRARPPIAAAGLFLWSLATLCSGRVTTYGALLAARSCIGVGEAGFGTVAPGMLADRYPRNRRGRILSLFYLAIPVGSALGYVCGGLLGQHFGWQQAFLVVGIPGLLLTPVVARLHDTRRIPDDASQKSGYGAVMKQFAANRLYVRTTLSMAAMTFALGGLAQWVPSFLIRSFQLDVGRANLLFGGITVVAGLVGTISGGWLGDYVQQRHKAGYLYVSVAGFLCGAPLAAVALMAPSLSLCLITIFLAELFLFLNTGPLNTVIVNSVGSSLRATAFAINIFVIHALGDAISPSIIGALSDIWGLRGALLITPLAIVVAAWYAWWGVGISNQEEPRSVPVR